MGAICCTPEIIDFNGEVELNHFELLHVVGEGAFGKVRIVQHKATSHKYALKYISKKRCKEQDAADNVNKERQLLEQIDHPFVVNLHYAFHDDQNLFMVLDLMLGGDLRFYMDAHTDRMNELQVRFYVAELALALNYLHAHGIAHRDIKPENILLDDQGHAHLTDFNIATRFDKYRSVRSSKAGSPGYMAPEMYAKTGYTTTVDWWSLGITIYELLFRKRPFLATTTEDLANAIQNDPLVFPSDANDHISLECLDLVTKLLEKSPSSRLGSGFNGANDIKEHPWFHDLDWTALERKEVQPLFEPEKNKLNFDLAHHLDELLLIEEPLRPCAKRAEKGSQNTNPDGTPAAPSLDSTFAGFYYARPTMELNEDIPVPYEEDSALAPEDSHWLRKMSSSLTSHYEQSKLRTQGYLPTPSDEHALTIPIAH